MKANSRRLPNKHFLPLGDRPLFHHVFDALVAVEGLDEIVAWTSNPDMFDGLPPQVVHSARPAELDHDSILGLDLFKAYAESRPADIYVLAHATAPFLTGASIQAAVDAVRGGDYDSAFTVERIQTYAWYENRPINYDLENMVQTQNVEPVYVETSGVYVFSHDLIVGRHRRIGDRPKLIEVSAAEAVDIDTYQDYVKAKIFAAEMA
jgi:CMP-N-acetylneuraminic acid synthetase